MASLATTLGVFKNRMFRTVWTASVIVNLGGLIQMVGAAWMMTLLTPSQSMVALVQASVAFPVVLLSLVAGVLADSFDRRKVMLAAQFFRLGVSLVLAVLAYENLLTPWLLLTFTFLVGCGTAMHNPSWQASLNEMVPREDLPMAVALNGMGMNITRAIGPALGGLIVSIAGVAMSFLVNVLTHSAIIWVLLRWKNERQKRLLPIERFGSALTAGVRYFAMSPNLMNSVFRGFAFSFGAITMQALMPSIARDQLGGNAFIYGILLGAFGSGAVLGVFLTPFIRERFNNEAISRITCIGFAAGSVVMGWSHSVLLSALAIFFSGIWWINLLALINVTVQLSSPRWVLGRLLSIYMTGIFSGMTIGSWVWGAVADAAGMPAALYGSAAVLVACLALGIRAPLPEHGSANLDHADFVNEPAPQLDLRQRSGPIKIMVEYEIDQADVPHFLALMTERRRARIRDGARRWALLRDLEHPDTWIESYLLPTWIEYIRHRERRTHEDAALADKLHALHKGPVPLVIHRMIERQTVTPTDDMARIDDRRDPLT